MKNIKKILPAVALAGAGIITLVGASNASAYNYHQVLGQKDGAPTSTPNPNNVEICYTLSNITNEAVTVFTVTLESNDGIDLSAVNMTPVPDSAYTAVNDKEASFTIAFDEHGAQSTKTNCVYLDFRRALPANSGFGVYTVDISDVTSSNPNIPADDNSRYISFGYQLEIDQTTKEPISHSGTYGAEYWTKTVPTLSSSIPLQYGHVEVVNKVRGNAADPDASFVYKVNATKSYPSIQGTTYNLAVGNSVTTCTYGTDCQFTLKHGETAYIGCSNSSCTNDGQFVRNGIAYTVTETDNQDHDTTYVDGSQGSIATGTIDDATKVHNFVNEKIVTISGRFFNILPFIVLAAIASVGVVTLHKTGKKNEA